MELSISIVFNQLYTKIQIQIITKYTHFNETDEVFK